MLSLYCMAALIDTPKNLKNWPKHRPWAGIAGILFKPILMSRCLKGMVDTYVSSGMKDAGYTYFVLDDGWMSMERDKDGNLVADPKKFPNGMKAFADYVHSKGLKFGIYNCAGTKTCAGYPGTRGYEYQDARLYASWGVDYLKFDWCNTDGINASEAYTTMSKAIRAAGRPMIFSLCEWGQHYAMAMGKKCRPAMAQHRRYSCRF